MRVLILLLISMSSFAQTRTYNTITFDFMGADSLTKTWNRSIKQVVTVTIDTIKKQLTIPNIQVYSNNTTRRNLLTDLVTMTADTTLVISGTTTLPWTIPVNISSDGYARGIYLNNRIGALLLPDYFFVIYPLWGKYYRVIEFTNK